MQDVVTTELLISSTQDAAGVQVQEVGSSENMHNDESELCCLGLRKGQPQACPLRLRAHAPLILLDDSLTIIFLPRFSNEMERERRYAICGTSVGRDFSLLKWEIPDGRFEVRNMREEAEKDCSGSTPATTYLTAVRRNDSGCGPWCSRYLSWEEGESYDLKLMHSVEECLTSAARLNISALFELAGSLLFDGVLDAQGCVHAV